MAAAAAAAGPPSQGWACGGRGGGAACRPAPVRAPCLRPPHPRAPGESGGRAGGRAGARAAVSDQGPRLTQGGLDGGKMKPPPCSEKWRGPSRPNSPLSAPKGNPKAAPKGANTTLSLLGKMWGAPLTAPSSGIRTPGQPRRAQKWGGPRPSAPLPLPLNGGPPPEQPLGSRAMPPPLSVEGGASAPDAAPRPPQSSPDSQSPELE